MVKGNHAIPYTRKFKKWWQRYTKVNFAAPVKKRARRVARQEAIAKNGPRPIGKLRPIVHRPSFRFNMQTKFGKGFTLEELKTVNLTKRVAQTVGIAVDHRRRNKSVESLDLNVARLKEYLEKLVVFPRTTYSKKIRERKANAKKVGGLPRDTPKSELDKVKAVHIAAAMPINQKSKVMKVRAPTAEEKAYNAYRELRKHRLERYLHGKKNKVDTMAV